jgi:hypothetical protein
MGPMADRGDNTAERPHDVLAAEEFGMGTADPALHCDPPHDVLAAEEFELPAGDPTLHVAPIEVPESPSVGPGPPRDVLAADAFAVPAGRSAPGRDGHGAEMPAAGSHARRLGLGLAGAAAAVLLLVWRAAGPRR